MTGAQWDVLDEAGKPIIPCGKDGKLDKFAVASRDAVMKELMEVGIDMEILSYKIYLEEPQGCTLISNSMNKMNEVALKTTELQALSSLTGEVTLQAESAVAGKACYNAVKAKVRPTLDTNVDEPDFIELFDFVIKLGANKNTHLPDFLKWCS